MNWKAKLAIICAVAISAAGVLWLAPGRQPSLHTMTYSQFLEKVRAGQIASVIVTEGNAGAVEAICRLKDGNAERTVLPADYRDAMMAMQDKRVDVEIRTSSWGPLPLVRHATPFLLLLGIWIWMAIGKFPNGPGQSMRRLVWPRQ